jgi:hypothetical protein
MSVNRDDANPSDRGHHFSDLLWLRDNISKIWENVSIAKKKNSLRLLFSEI